MCLPWCHFVGAKGSGEDMQLLGIAKFLDVMPAKYSSRESRVRGRVYLLGR